jgi:hypothetical protein
MTKPDWTLIGALVALEVIPFEAAELLEKLYAQREFIVPINVSEALTIATEVFNSGDDDPESGEESLVRAVFDETDKFDPPGWWLMAHERWHDMILAGEIENDCAE